MRQELEKPLKKNYAELLKEKLENRFQELKKELTEVQHSETLNKYYILSEAWSIGKKLHGKDYTLARLGFDMECPYTTTKRIMSLQKASKEVWQQIRAKKIGAHKVAQILMAVDNDIASGVIQSAIDEDWSTSQIKKYRQQPNFKAMKLEIAVDKGFTRTETAMKSFNDTCARLETLMKLDLKTFTPEKKLVLDSMLRDLRNKINAFLPKLK